jgi:F-type H+-transporting ATPase subunit beta
VFVAEQFTGKKGIYTKREHTLKSFDAICNGEADDLPEQAFLYVGTLDDVRARAKEMA